MSGSFGESEISGGSLDRMAKARAFDRFVRESGRREEPRTIGKHFPFPCRVSLEALSELGLDLNEGSGPLVGLAAVKPKMLAVVEAWL